MRAYNNRGNIYDRTGRYDLALKDFEAAAKVDPTSVLSLMNCASVYYQTGRFDRAIDFYSQVIKLQPNGSNNFAYRGDAYVRQDQAGPAMQDYDQAIKLDPKNSYAFQARGRLNYLAGALPNALADFSQASALDPKDGYTALWLDIVTRHSKLPSHLQEATARLDMTRWPAPIVRLYLGQLTPEAVLAAADNPNPAVKRYQVCKAEFFTGELELAQGRSGDAAQALHRAAAQCPKGVDESKAADLELKRLKL